MCGIVGLLFSENRRSLRQRSSAMLELVKHRGPDAHGIWIDESAGVALGNTRLAVIDIAGGQQPMLCQEARFIGVFNGEIYNFREVAEELRSVGVLLRTNSDTEVIVEGYAKWGGAVLDRLRGMYAIAIYDCKNHTLFLARDKLGIKPLYWAKTDEEFLFSSEIKSIAAISDLPKCVNHDAIFDVMCLGFPLSPRTAFKGINELEPGTFANVSTNSIEIKRFFKWEDEGDLKSSGIEHGEVREAISSSVRDHLVADVPVGAFLSGGVDSSLVAAIASEEILEPLQTFHFKFNEQSFDESSYAQKVADLIRSNHHEVLLNQSSGSFAQIEDIFSRFDQPFADSSAVPTFLICREMSSLLKVVLSGDGGDEMFGGYRRFYLADLLEFLHINFSTLLNSIVFTKFVPSASGGHLKGLRRQACRVLSLSRLEDEKRLQSLIGYLVGDRGLRAFSPSFLELYKDYEMGLSTEPTQNSFGGRHLRELTIRKVLHGDYLRKVDVMSSASGLEVRLPLLGDQVIEVAKKLKRNQLYNWRSDKIMLKKIASERLPHNVVYRKKFGFGLPIDSFLNSKAKAEVADLLLSPSASISPLLKKSYVIGLLNAFETRQQYFDLSRYQVYQQVYLLLSIELWMKKWALTV